MAGDFLEAFNLSSTCDRWESGRLLRGGAKGSAFAHRIGARRGGVFPLVQRVRVHERGTRQRGRHRGEWKLRDESFPGTAPT